MMWWEGRGSRSQGSRHSTHSTERWDASVRAYAEIVFLSRGTGAKSDSRGRDRLQATGGKGEESA